MRTRVIATALALTIAGSTAAQAQSVNTLTDAEKKQGWVLLFNGKDFDGWRQCNGTAHARQLGDRRSGHEGLHGRRQEAGPGIERRHPVRRQEVPQLRAVDRLEDREGRATRASSSTCGKCPASPSTTRAPEVQVLDNVDATDNKIPSHLAGSLYDMLAADPKSVKPVGEWNTIVIRVKDGKVTHTQNGMKVVEYTLWTPEWDAMVQNSKFKTFPGFIEGIAKEGYIGLQDHGYAIWFRNIKIREL